MNGINAFLDKIAQELIINFGENLSEVKVILPNKRSKVFLLQYLSNRVPGELFSPEILSIEDFIAEVAKMRYLDPIELLFDFYEVYKNITKDNVQSFDFFSNWAKVLIQDFNDIDKYLLSPKYVLSYLKDIEDIKHWAVDSDKRTTLIDKHLLFWETLPDYYDAFYKMLLSKKAGYQGLVYREASVKIPEYINSDTTKSYVFAGFNALTPVETLIIQEFVKINKALVYWDIDRVFFNDAYQEAGLFIRKIKNDWAIYKNNIQDFNWIFDEFKNLKNIEIIGTPKSVGQAKIAGSIIKDKINYDTNTVENTAVILSEETLLMPLLYSLPESLKSLNITMGYSAKNNPVQVLINKIFRLHISALSRGNNYVFYYKDLLEILRHPLIEPFINAQELIKTIRVNNITFITLNKLSVISSSLNSGLFDLIFSKWEGDLIEILNKLTKVLHFIKFNLGDSEQEKVTKAFVYEVYKIINKLKNYHSKVIITSVNELYLIYKQIIDLATVSFEGEPLTGLQVMGFLESRNLDFENIIITSVNEGKLPLGKTQNSLIPFDVRTELGLPTFREKDAVYAYHFYRLLQRAKNIYLIYNTESDGLDGGEKSRYITQLEIETQKNHTISHQVFNFDVPEKSHTAIEIVKSKSVLERLKEISTRGFSPSALTTYVMNPMQFYYQKILKINEVDDVEENIEARTLGTIIHKTLENLYLPYLNQILKVEDIDAMLQVYENQVYLQFKEIFKEGEITKGKNLLAFEAAKRNIFNFLNLEKKTLLSGDVVKVLYMETRFERNLQDARLPYDVLIGGEIDRIEERNGVIRIVDYKTGKVDNPNLVISDWGEMLTNQTKLKTIQLLSYVFVFEHHALGRMIETGIISFKNLSKGFLPFVYKQDKQESVIVDEAILSEFKEILITLIAEILDKDVPFKENEE